MYIFAGYYIIFIEESISLKDKRQPLKSIIDNLRNKFKVSVAEVDFQNDIRKGAFGISAVSGDKKIIGSLSQKIEDFIEGNYPGRLIDKHIIIEDVGDLSD